ncbi:hypothetical protein RJT34_26635 [Clitoria ternatea]|uniref:Uncharacterized protein n=1 Tax=Clitoria ternatea TaxID=43366 RepID=A0AAN9IFW4_CLITE
MRISSPHSLFCDSSPLNHLRQLLLTSQKVKFSKSIKFPKMVSEFSFEESDNPKFEDDDDSAYAIFDEFGNNSEVDDMKMVINPKRASTTTLTVMRTPLLPFESDKALAPPCRPKA